MAIDINVEIEENPNLEFELETLQFVGIADHNQLTNREMERQHPIGAIEGLVSVLDETNAVVTKLNETQAALAETVIKQGERLDEHEQRLIEQSAAIEDVDRFKENIATVEMVEEVLQNG